MESYQEWRWGANNNIETARTSIFIKESFNQECWNELEITINHWKRRYWSGREFSIGKNETTANENSELQ